MEYVPPATEASVATKMRDGNVYGNAEVVVKPAGRVSPATVTTP
jgi:hypothetical protein